MPRIFAIDLGCKNQEPFSTWVETLSLQPYFDGLSTVHNEFKSLISKRIDEASDDETPQQKVVKQKLVNVILVTLASEEVHASGSSTNE